MSEFKSINEAIKYGVAGNCVHFHLSLEDVHEIAARNMDSDRFSNASDAKKFIKATPEIDKLFVQALNFVESNEFRDEYPNVEKIFMISPLISKHIVQRMLSKYGFEIRDFSQMGLGEKSLARKIFKSEINEVSVAEKLLV